MFSFLGKFIPHSWRAAVAGIVAFVATSLLVNGMVGLTGTSISADTVVMLVVGVVVGMPATAAYSYLQYRDAHPRGGNESLEALNAYSREQYLRDNKPTVVTSNKDDYRGSKPADS